MTEPTSAVYDGRYSEACAEACQEGGCGARGPYTSWCGGCCQCRGGCAWGYWEWKEEQQQSGEAPHADT